MNKDDLNEGDNVKVILTGTVTEIFDEGVMAPSGVSVNLDNQGELRLGGIDVFIEEENMCNVKKIDGGDK